MLSNMFYPRFWRGYKKCKIENSNTLGVTLLAEISYYSSMNKAKVTKYDYRDFLNGTLCIGIDTGSLDRK